MLRRLAPLIMAVFAGGLWSLWPWLKSFATTPYLATGFQAKTVCSCLFVMGGPELSLSEAFCLALAEQVPERILKTAVDYNRHTVHAGFLSPLGFATQTAIFRGGRFGCELAED